MLRAELSDLLRAEAEQGSLHGHLSRYGVYLLRAGRELSKIQSP